MVDDAADRPDVRPMTVRSTCPTATRDDESVTIGAREPQPSSRSVSSSRVPPITTSLIVAVAVAAAVGSALADRHAPIEAAGEALGAGGEYHAAHAGANPRHPRAGARRRPGRSPSRSPDRRRRRPVQRADRRQGRSAGVRRRQRRLRRRQRAGGRRQHHRRPPDLAGLPRGVRQGREPGRRPSLVNFQAGEVVANTGDPASRLRRPAVDPAGTRGATAPATCSIDVFGWFSSSAYTDRVAPGSSRSGPAASSTPARPPRRRTPLAGGAQRKIQIRGADAPTRRRRHRPDSRHRRRAGQRHRRQPRRRAASRRSCRVVPEPVPRPAPRSPATSTCAPARCDRTWRSCRSAPTARSGSTTVSATPTSSLDVMGYFVRRPDDTTAAGRVVPLVAPFRVLRHPPAERTTTRRCRPARPRTGASPTSPTT